MPLILYRPKKNLLALFATGVSNARVSLVVTCNFAKAPAAALRSSRLMTAPLSPAHPGQMPLSGMKAKCIALLIKLVRHPSQHPPSATSPLHQHSAGGSEALQFGPTLGQDEAARSSVRVNEPIRVPSSGCKGYWTNANAALEAVIKLSCLGLCSSPPEQALRQLCAVICNFFSQPVSPTSQRDLPYNQLRTAPLFGPFARSSATSVGNGDSAPANQPLRMLPYAMIST